MMGELRSLPDIDYEFVVPQTKEGLGVPAPFEALGLQFYEVGTRC